VVRRKRLLVRDMCRDNVQVFTERRYRQPRRRDSDAQQVGVHSVFNRLQKRKLLVAVRRTATLISPQTRSPRIFSSFPVIRGRLHNSQRIKTGVLEICDTREEFNVRVAIRQPNVHPAPARPQLCQPLFRGFQFSFSIWKPSTARFYLWPAFSGNISSSGSAVSLVSSRASLFMAQRHDGIHAHRTSCGQVRGGEREHRSASPPHPET